jgi:hypothetical protein
MLQVQLDSVKGRRLMLAHGPLCLALLDASVERLRIAAIRSHRAPVDSRPAAVRTTLRERTDAACRYVPRAGQIANTIKASKNSPTTTPATMKAPRVGEPSAPPFRTIDRRRVKLTGTTIANTTSGIRSKVQPMPRSLRGGPNDPVLTYYFLTATQSDRADHPLGKCVVPCGRYTRPISSTPSFDAASTELPTADPVPTRSGLSMGT